MDYGCEDRKEGLLTLVSLNW